MPEGGTTNSSSSCAVNAVNLGQGAIDTVPDVGGCFVLL